MLPGFDVTPCFGRPTRLPHPLQLFLPQMTLNRSTRLVLRTLLSGKGDGSIFYLLTPGLNLDALTLAMVFQGVTSERPLFLSLPFVAST
jgi:hypothetical protein